VYVSVIVPCYRSATTLPTLVEGLSRVLPDATSAYEVVLIVDGSPDNTWEVASGLADRYPDVRAIRLARNYGQHNALIAGVRSARHEIIVTMDDDLQHPPDQVPVLLAALTDDLDLVYGLPEKEEHGVVRSFMSRTVKAMMSVGLDIHNAKLISAFRAFRTFLRDGLDGLHGPHASVDVALSWGTTRVGATIVRMEDRADGRSNYTTRALIRHAINMLTGYSIAPLRAVSCLGLTCALGGLVLLGVILVRYLTGNTTVAGFTSTTSMVALFSGVQLLGIGVLGEYVGRLHFSGMGRPTYVIRERTDTNAHPEIVEDRSR
jgi:glycosyltransferase involved in cell wall biosynthesis